MRKICAMLLAVLLLLNLVGCGGMKDVQAEPEEEKTETPAEEEAPEEPAEEKSIDISAVLESDPEKSVVIETRYYTLTLPEYWAENCVYEMKGAEPQTIVFYDKANKPEEEADRDGWLFSLCFPPLSNKMEDYPSHEELCPVLLNDYSKYKAVLIFPTDVQYEEGKAESYLILAETIHCVTDTLSFKEGARVMTEEDLNQSNYPDYEIPQDTNKPQQPAEAPAEEKYVLSTHFYSVSFPASWEENSVVVKKGGEYEDDSVALYSKADYKTDFGGHLGSIIIYREGEDYSYLPSYEKICSAVFEDIGAADIVLIYPTDVQFSDANSGVYHEMMDEMKDAIKQLKPNT